MSVYGTFIRNKWKNEKTGITSFLICENGKTVLCNGITTSLTYGSPLKLDGAYEDGIFKATKVRLCGFNHEVIKTYLCTSEFPNVKEITAEKIIGYTGEDIFGFIREHKSVDEAMDALKTECAALRSVLTKIADKTRIEDVLDYIESLGGSYYSAQKLCKSIKTNTLDVVNANPYLLLYSDVAITTVEKIAKSAGIKVHDHKRLSAIVEYALDANNRRGNTKITFGELVKFIHGKEKEAGYDTDSLFIAEELTNQKYKVIEEDGDFYVYSNKDYQTEKEIASHIKRLSMSSKANDFNPIYIEETEKTLGIEYAKEQKDAFNIIKSSGVKIVTGGPGTGKTTFLNGCISIYKKVNPYIKIVLCAPTGCAAARMHDSTGMSATTIHKLLGLSIEKTTYTGKLDADVVILDESSMVGIELFNTLLGAIKNGATLILVGDKNQLPSIDAGNVLSDLIESDAIETYHLEKVFRNKEAIISNANLVINGSTNLVQDDNFQIRRYEDENSMLKALSSACKSSKADYTVFTAAKKTKFKSGSICLNRLVRSAICARDEIEVPYGEYLFRTGDKVIFNKNNYDKGYYNGEVGTITNIQKIDSSLRMAVTTDEGTLFLEDADLNDIDLGYVLTAHKAQGSECENAIIVIAQNPANMLQRRLLYVEITRAKKKVLIMTEGNALERCIKKDSIIDRKTGLKNHLHQNFAY